MFYKGDSIYLYIVDLGSEFNGFGFLASDNGAKVMPVDTHDTVGHFGLQINSSLAQEPSV